MTGEVLRRLVGRALLRAALPTLRQHLQPHQLAVGIPAGAEVMPHLLRRWRGHFCGDTGRVCLAYDQSNAHNVVDRHAFLSRMQEVAPGLSRWLEYIYPTNKPSNVFYRDTIILSAAGGQQGCPLMTACHAVVQHMLLESLGLVAPPAGTALTLPRLEPPAQLDMAPCFADDGFLAGASGEVLRALKHLLAVMPQVGLRFSSLQLVAAAGPHHRVNFDPFLALGCSVNGDGDIEVLKSPIGTDAFCQSYSQGLVDKQLGVLDAVAAIPDAQVGFYLLKYSCNASRLHHLSRTTPLAHCEAGLLAFDAGMRAAFQRLVGCSLDSTSWRQAMLPLRCGGLGLRPSAAVADAAYLGSRVATAARCAALWPSGPGDGDLDRWVASAVAGCNLRLHDAGLPSSLRPVITNGLQESAVTKQLDQAALAQRKADVTPDDVCRLHAGAATGARTLWELTPSTTLDNHLSNADFAIAARLRLGVDVAGDASCCRFCGSVADAGGRHALSCMSGGGTL